MAWSVRITRKMGSVLYGVREQRRLYFFWKTQVPMQNIISFNELWTQQLVYANAITRDGIKVLGNDVFHWADVKSTL